MPRDGSIDFGSSALLRACCTALRVAKSMAEACNGPHVMMIESLLSISASPWNLHTLLQCDAARKSSGSSFFRSSSSFLPLSQIPARIWQGASPVPEPTWQRRAQPGLHLLHRHFHVT